MNDNFKCPYSKKECTHVQTDYMTSEFECENCECYNNGVRATGDMPVVHELLNWIRKIFINWN